MNKVKSILLKKNLDKEDIINLLKATGKEKELIFKKAFEIKEKYSGNKVWYRALIEISNVCIKDCYYCGIRKSNTKVERYTIPEEEVKKLIFTAFSKGFQSIVIQGGEITGKPFTEKITNILSYATSLKKDAGITLSLGEQSEEVLKKWFYNGANRYLLRIETSNAKLYKKLHPPDDLHNFENRLKALKLIQDCGYQTGTGVMIGLPFQTIEDLADDLLFMRNFDIDMCGMGPYMEHSETPLFKYRTKLWTLKKRAELTLLMIAILRILMKDINIASTTALNSIGNDYLKKGIKVGGNVIMPNITPNYLRKDYFLYENKHSFNSLNNGMNDMELFLKTINHSAGEGIGTSAHFIKKTFKHH